MLVGTPGQLDRGKITVSQSIAGTRSGHWHLPQIAIGAMIHRVWAQIVGERLRSLPCLLAIAVVWLVSAVGEGVQPYVTGRDLSLMYLLGVLGMAIRFGLWPSLITAVLSVAALDFLFLPPLYSLTIGSPQDALLLAFFAVVAVIASGLASRLREQVLIAERNAERIAALCQFAGKLAGTLTLDSAITAVVEQVTDMLHLRASVFLGGDTPPVAPLTLPLLAAGERVGTMTVHPAESELTSGEERRVLNAIAELAGIAIGRQTLADRLALMGIEREADRLRSALLNSIAHDLTGPIASVASALTSLKSDYETYDDATRRELIGDAEREATHLHHFSANLVHMTRLEAGVVELRREQTDIGDLVGSALVRARNLLGSRRVIVGVPPGLPRPALDFVLMEQVIFNLLENAGKYTPADATITITAEQIAAGVALMIADDGLGFPAEDSERIFAKFYRAKTAAENHGTGLGLAICRGFVEAHGGTITATNRPGRGGALFTITLREGERPEPKLS
jgi:two-component system sensor histidine kinase KdpD